HGADVSVCGFSRADTAPIVERISRSGRKASLRCLSRTSPEGYAGIALSAARQFHTMPSTSDTGGDGKVTNAWSYNWARGSLETLYAGLTRVDSVQPVDLIFVMAGRMNRKRYGFELYRQGVAPKLVLSVGRFEVSKMLQTEFAFADELAALRSATPPDQRHFFVSLDQFGTRMELASVPHWNTYGEVVGLMRHLEREHVA